jgi:hypothetical protein
MGNDLAVGHIDVHHVVDTTPACFIARPGAGCVVPSNKTFGAVRSFDALHWLMMMSSDKDHPRPYFSLPRRAGCLLDAARNMRLSRFAEYRIFP